MPTTEEKLTKIFDKEPLEFLPGWVQWIKTYSLTRFQKEVTQVKQTEDKLNQQINEITNGGKP